jgi:CHAT domain-containing protein
MERCAIELGELKQDLDDLQPTVLHVAAHVEYGLVHLSAEDAKVSAATGYDLGAAIRNANVPPALVVLSGCDTGTVCQMLTGPGHLASGIPVPAATGWHGNLNDRQARLFTERFYARLAAGATVNEAFDGPFITVTTRWPGQAQPYLSGNAVMVPFPAGPALSE